MCDKQKGWDVNIPPLLFITISLLIKLLFSLQCSWFKEREAETPGGEECWVYPDSAHKVLENLSSALSCINIENYLNCLDSLSFRFYPDDDLLFGPNGEKYENWDFTKEKNYITALFQTIDPTVPVVFEFTIDTIDSGRNYVRYFVDYTIDIKPSGLSSLHSEGRSDLTVEEDATGLWYISTWYDYKKDTIISWAEIKARDY